MLRAITLANGASLKSVCAEALYYVMTMDLFLFCLFFYD